MFKFAGFINRKRFLGASMLRIGLLLASIAGFPYLMAALGSASNCRAADACGAVGLVGALVFKPLVFVLFVLSFLGISVRRTRDAGIPAWVGLLVPALFAAEYKFLMVFGTSWAFAFSTGVLRLSFPIFAVLALVCIAVLCVLPPRGSPASRNPNSGGLIAVGLGFYVVAFAALVLMNDASESGSGFLASLLDVSTLWSAAKPISWAMIGVAVVLAGIAGRDGSRIAAGPEQIAGEPAQLRPVPKRILVVIASVATLIAFKLSLSAEASALGWLTFLTHLTFVILPTLALYSFLAIAAFVAAARRTTRAWALLALAFLPFAHWGYAHWMKAAQHDREAAEIAAIATAPAPHLPPTIVVESSHVPEVKAVLSVSGIQHVIAKGAYGQNRLMQFDRDARSPRAVQTLPEEYLLLKVGRSSSFAKSRQIYHGAGGPLELRFIGPQRDDLVAVWYRAFNPGPSATPLLTSYGWFRSATNSVSPSEIQESVRSFLAKALMPSR